MNETLGTWRNPPLAYVVAELVISPYYSMATKIPWFQDRLRSKYPRTIEGKTVVVQDDKPVLQSIWHLVSADQMYGVQFGERAIAIHATRYQHSRDFIARWAEILDAIQTAQLDAFVERAGIRYVDLIVPSEDKEPAEYVVQQLQGIRPEGAQVKGWMLAAAFQFKDSLVNLRAGAPSPAGMLLPPDFNALPLQKPMVMLAAEERVKENKQIGFIDTDCLRDIKQVFNAADLVGIYTNLQIQNSRAFRSAISAIAQQEWM